MAIDRSTTRTPLLAILVVLAACGDDTVSAPDPTPGSVALDADSVRLELRDSVRLSATVLDESGAPLQGVAPTWTSSDQSVATVDGFGLVLGVGAGTARITASAEGASATTEVTVLAWNITDNAVVIDSTTSRLVSAPEERAAGIYRFRTSGQSPAIGAGDVIVGAQDGGFLRRVTAISTDGAEVLLQTDPASLSDIIEEGTFETVVDDLTFEAGIPAPVGPLRPGEVRWGAPEFHPAMDGVALTPQGAISLSGLDICAELKKLGGATCPSGISKLEVKTGVLDFGPEFGLEATFSGLSLEKFRGTAKGTVSSDFDILLEAKTSADLISPQIKIADVTRPFYGQIGPVPVLGYVELALTGGLEAKATAKGSIQAGFSSSHSVEVGAEWQDGPGWSEVFENQRTFDAREPDVMGGTLSGQIDLETRLFVKPEVKVIFYGVVGPFLNVEPYGKFTMTFGTTSCGMKSEAGINSEIGFTIPFLDPATGTHSKKNAPWFVWPGREWTCPLGTLDVSTVTNGQQTDPDGYTVRIDSVSKGSVASTGQAVFDFIEVGSREVTLEGIASNCSVTGANPVSVTIVTGLVTPVDFDVECKLPGGDLTVEVETTGANPDPDGYTVTLDRSQTKTVGTNGSVTFANVPQGVHEVWIEGLAPNCSLSGGNPRTINLTSANATLPVEIDCPATRLVVNTATEGIPANDDWSLVLDGSLARSTGPNAQVTFEVGPGTHSLRLDGVPANCTVEGDNPRGVDVATTTVTETFRVTCAVGGVQVSVATTGDPAPATSYTVDVGGDGKSVSPNGSVTFPEVPEGVIAVELTGLPSHCIVIGENPRQVSVPGSTAFEVLCEEPLECEAAPGSAQVWVIDGPTETWDKSLPKPTMEWSLDPLAYGDLGARTNVTQSHEEQVAIITASAAWEDYWKFIPVDQTRAGERASVRVEVAGSLELNNADQEGAAYLTILGSSWRIWPSDAVSSLNVNETLEVDIALGEWASVYSSVSAEAALVGHAGASASTAASGRVVRVVDVVDADGLTVPIVQTCTASGHAY